MRRSPDTAIEALSSLSWRAAPLMVRLPLMSREALESEVDVSGNGSELRGHVDHAKRIERQKERTRADSVVGICALSADIADRSTSRRADIYGDDISTTHAMSIGGRRRYRR